MDSLAEFLARLVASGEVAAPVATSPPPPSSAAAETSPPPPASATGLPPSSWGALAFRPRASPAHRTRSRSPARRARYDEREQSRSRSRTRYRRDRSERSPANGNNGSREYASNYDNSRAPPASRKYEDRPQSKEQMSGNSKESSQDRRVYVGNLAYDVKWGQLKDFMRQAGDVVFADVLLLANGMSKGCGIVEYSSRDEAQTAITTLSNQNLMGRLVYVREDREMEPRFNNAGPPARGGFDGGYGARGGFGGGFGGPPGGGMGMQGRGGGGNQIFVSNLPYQVGWQDLKDLFRQAGQIMRADVHMMPDGRPKGTGIVAFDNPEDAANAISSFNGYDWQGRVMEVREDRYAGGGGFGGPRGGFNGGFRGGFGGGFPPRGGFGGGFAGGRGGFGGGFAGGRGGYGGGGYGGPQAGGFGGGQGGGHGGPSNHGPAAAAVPANPFVDFATSNGAESTTIFVRNLPWSTSNDDLIELFITIGKVERAEIKMEFNMRSSGTGVVQFASQDDAATAISKFSGYQYGGRPLGLSYVRYSNQGGDMMEGAETTGNMQEQMM
ncbi:g-strand binding protein [Friedmanniomyces endolithicus]|uniref:G-strand binding protein n=1 Tax=Rachicladosporium monterosium TaxID=1507873 RepID=A0ABR0LFR7_9PEZI|nr:g-strand binding protein [Friedmanniomyces endolithicus]KAK1089384.1 g-strand binding protein [Friedmanniomyces endolithicus]KAK5148093.1 g-strand binding protein [Rachicladosporium monterosium]